MKENLIIDYLLSNEEYFRKVLPHVKREYFSDTGCKIIFGIVEDYYNEYVVSVDDYLKELCLEVSDLMKIFRTIVDETKEGEK